MVSGFFNCAKQNKNVKYFVTHRRCITTIKTDQINILRKQYDTFLEEDKKRKERNECILEKLDRIRLSNTMARYKSNVFLDHRVSFNCTAETPTPYANPQTNNVAKQPSSVNSIRKYKEALIPTAMDILPKPLDERYLINEISKKYILIPKLRSFDSEDYIPRAIQHDNNNDNDWKSKYNILDKLKQSEKEEMGFSALNDRNENLLDHTPSRESKYRNDSKELDVGKDKDDMYSEEYAPKPQTDMAKLNDEEDTKLNNIVDVKTEGTNETERRSDTSSKLGPNISRTELGAEIIDIDENTNNNFKGVTGEQQRLQSDRITGVSEIKTPKNTYPVQSVNEDEPALFKNIDNQHNDQIYNDKYENEANEKVTPVVDDISLVKGINRMKPAVLETNNENHNIGSSDTLEYPADNVQVQHFAPAQRVILADRLNINVHGSVESAEQQAYLAPNQYVSEPVAESEKVYLPGDQLLGDQYVSEQTMSAEQAYLPVSDRPPGSDQYVSEPATAEHVYLPGSDQLPDGNQQYVSEPMVSEEQAYLSGDNTQTGSGEQNVFESIAVAAERKNTSESEGQQINNETHDPTMDDTVTSDIAEYEAEQNQMFYSEETNYQDYNQAAVGDAYNPENIGYDPELYYQQQEAAYPVEINEHEETSQRYDPSFEQQYAGNSEEPQQYVDQQLYGEQQQYDEQQYAKHYPDQQYEDQLQSELDGTTHVYDQIPGEAVSEQHIMEQVQQGLDNEDLNVLNQTGSASNDLEESTVYMQNPGDVAPAEPRSEYQETPKNVS